MFVSANRDTDMGIARFGRIYLAFWIVAGALCPCTHQNSGEKTKFKMAASAINS
jgi:hypothetical protein